MKTKSAIVITLLLFFSGCATLHETKTYKVPVSNKLEISKSIEVKKNEPTGLKRKVAIGRFTNETRYGQSFFVDKNSDKIGKQAMDK